MRDRETEVNIEYVEGREVGYWRECTGEVVDVGGVQT